MIPPSVNLFFCAFPFQILRPGYSRFSLTYWMSKEDIDYILDAILFVAEHGWKFQHLYRLHSHNFYTNDFFEIEEFS